MGLQLVGLGESLSERDSEGNKEIQRTLEEPFFPREQGWVSGDFHSALFNGKCHEGSCHAWLRWKSRSSAKDMKRTKICMKESFIFQ